MYRALQSTKGEFQSTEVASSTQIGLSGCRTRQYSTTPPSRAHSAKENIPVDTPEPAATPAQRVLPPPIDLEGLYRRDDEDNHKVFTEGLIALTEASREKVIALSCLLYSKRDPGKLHCVWTPNHNFIVLNIEFAGHHNKLDQAF